ncbi:hypothetical protein [Chengkuizengella sediminis]|nr:hypothetical protein [Chengkuizengella sediminis]NDI35639.1 hypothetical protein [Chengkuizengella sediminis]
MRKGASLDYECRRCGKVVKDSHAPDGPLAVVYPIIGVIDLIGCEFDKE